METAGMKGYCLNPPHRRGIRVGSAQTRVVGAFIPDLDIGHPHKESRAPLRTCEIIGTDRLGIGNINHVMSVDV